jgi:hypothetical protein
VRGIFFSHETTSEQREPGLHEENEVAGVQRPRNIRPDSNVSDTVGKLYGEWFLGGLRLVVVKVFFVLRVVGSVLVRWLRHDKRIASGINDAGLIAGGCASRIWLRPIIGDTQHRRCQYHSRD